MCWHSRDYFNWEKALELARFLTFFIFGIDGITDLLLLLEFSEQVGRNVARPLDGGYPVLFDVGEGKAIVVILLLQPEPHHLFDLQRRALVVVGNIGFYDSAAVDNRLNRGGDIHIGGIPDPDAG